MKRPGRGADVAALLGLALLALQLLYLCGGPLRTNDLWWHLAMGEVYAREGPWPDGDPLLHTAHDDAPVQHEWLFGVGVHGVEVLAGLDGLRVAHVLAVVGILGLGLAALRRESPGLAEAAAATAVFAVLAWPRLMQLRPDLVSIPATLLVWSGLLAPRRRPGWGVVAASAVGIGLWANAHSLFALGPLLGVAALMGIALRVGLARWAGARGAEVGVEPAREARHARRLAVALGLALAASLLNPRGIGQHLTFFTSSAESAIWAVIDEWARFDPFSPPAAPSVSVLAWGLADAVLLLFAASALAVSLRFLRRPGRETLAPADPLLLGVASAAVLAALASVRFLWMGIFPLLYVLRALRLAGPAPRSRALAWAAAGIAAALAVAMPQVPFHRARLARIPRAPAAYLEATWDVRKFHGESVRFLEETGLEGNLFNSYAMGGFLGYRLAPRLRTFIDSRTEHYGLDVFEDYLAAQERRGGKAGEDLLGLLDRRGVDVFHGTGAPGDRHYTSAHLERAPGWLPVWRTVKDALYLRRNESNAANLARVEAWYRTQRVPFDAEQGVDPARVIRERPEWARRWGWVRGPAADALLRSRPDGEPEHPRDLALRGWSYARLGAYEEAIAAERALIALDPDARRPRQRLVYDLLRLDRPVQALVEARALMALAPEDPRSRLQLRLVREYVERSRRPRDPSAPPAQALLGLVELSRP